MSGSSTPPAWLTALARVVVGRTPWAEIALGDLSEEFAGVEESRGRVLATCWLLGQITGLAFQRATLGMTRVLRARINRGQPRGDGFVRALVRELRLGVRMWRSQKLVAAAVIVTLALGLGATTVAFAMARALLLRPFSFPDSDRIALIWQPSTSNDLYPESSVSRAEFQDWRAQSTTFETLAAFAWNEANVSDGTRPERVRGFQVSGGFFETFRLAPSAGRFLDRSDETAGRSLAVISDGFWRSHFGGRQDVIGRALRIDGDAFEIIGVAPAPFDFPMGAQFWVALPMGPDALAHRDHRTLTVIGRLATGRSFDNASSEMSQIHRHIAAAFPKEEDGVSIRVVTLARGMADIAAPEMLSLIGVASLVVLIIGCANVAGLLLARGWDRRREIAVRLALGGSRFRIVRQLIADGLVLGIIAVPLALVIAQVVLVSVKHSLPARIVPFVAGWTQIGVDAGVALFTTAAAVVATVLLGLFTALQASRPAIAETLHEGGRSSTVGKRRLLARRVFVAAELALALPLLVVGALTGLGAMKMSTGWQGYDPSGVESMSVALPDGPYARPDTRRQFAEQLIDRARVLPGVRAVATINVVPTTTASVMRAIDIDGQPPRESNRYPEVAYRVTSPQYFAVMGIPLVAGRGFGDADRAETLPVAMVSRAMAAHFWPGENPIGRRVRVVDPDEPDALWMTIVGTTADIIDDWFDRRNVPMLYVPMTQRPSYSVTLVTKSEGDPALLAPAFRRVLAAVDPDVAEYLVISMVQSQQERTSGLRSIGTMMVGLGILALVLSAIGIYSLMAYVVSQRRHEIGLRMALGATRGGVVRLMFGQSGRLAFFGLGIGLGLTAFVGLAAERALFGLVALEPALVIVVTVLLATVAVLATVVPAQHAARIDPATALRLE